MMTCLPSIPRSAAASAAASRSDVGRPGEIRLALQHQRIGALVGKHVLAELRAEHREPLGDLGKPLLLLRRQRRALAHEGEVQPLEHARLLLASGRAPPRLRLQRLDAAEERLVQEDRRAVLGEDRRDVALDLLQRLVGVGAGKV